MSKKVLCVDLGDVLVQFESKYIHELLRPESGQAVEKLVLAHDRGQLDFFDMYNELRERGHFVRPVSWGEMVQALAKCLYAVHAPMFAALSELKKRGVKLVCVTDNNHFCFYLSCYKFPGICDLFKNDDGRELWMLSHKHRSLKRDGLFVRYPTDFGFNFRDSAFVDNFRPNLEAAVKAGFKKNSVFLYDRYNPENHKRFLKFLDKHFPA